MAIFKDIKKEKLKSFPGQERGEKVYMFLKRHPLSFLGFFLITVVMLLVPFVIYFGVVQMGSVELNEIVTKVIITLVSAYVLFVMGFFLVGWIDYYLDVVIITNKRLIDINQQRLFARNIAEANLVDVEDVNAEVKGILNTFFHYGTVHVQTAGTQVNLEFLYIPNPYKVAKIISDLHEEAVEEEEKREAREIGATIVRKTENNHHVSGPEIAEAAKDLSEKRRERDYMPPNRQNLRKKDDTPEQDTPSSAAEPKPKKPEPPKRDNDFGHDDLEKGGEIDL